MTMPASALAKPGIPSRLRSSLTRQMALRVAVRRMAHDYRPTADADRTLIGSQVAGQESSDLVLSGAEETCQRSIGNPFIRSASRPADGFPLRTDVGLPERALESPIEEARESIASTHLSSSPDSLLRS
jgi:hypothetical protein